MIYHGNAKKVIDVNTGVIKVSKENVLLRSVAIGSCIVIAGYDCRNKTGAMAHIMLPGKAPDNAPVKAKYAADAIGEMIYRMGLHGTRKDDIEVCLVGGGNVLRKENDTICQANIMSVTRLLAETDISVRASVLGGMDRKSAYLEVFSGRIFFRKGDGKQELLWQPDKDRKNDN